MARSSAPWSACWPVPVERPSAPRRERRQPPPGAAAGAIGGGTTGTPADLTNWGLKTDYLDTAATYLLPGKTAVVAEVEEGTTAPIDAAVARHGGIVYREAITV